MARRFLTPISLVALSSDPVSGSEGDAYFNTSSNKIKVYYDGVWNDLSSTDSVTYSNSFETISTPSGTSPVADSSTDTLSITASNGMVVTGDSATDTVDFSTNATSSNTASTIVSRDADQSFDITAIDFDITDTISSALGRLRWNSAEGTVSLGISSTKDISIGEDQIYRVRNSTGSTLNKGVAVYSSGIEPSGRISISPYVANGSVREVRFMGLVAESINNGVNGFVQNFGYVTGLDTRGTASTAISVGDEDWAEGDIIYVHPTVAGKLTNVKPQHEITVAIIIKRHQTEGVIFVRPSTGGHLEDIHDISITSPSNGQALTYESATGLWKNTSIDALPSQTGSSGKYLTTDGSIPSWSNIPDPIIPSGIEYPTTNLQDGILFYNTNNGRTAINIGNTWKEFAYIGDVAVIDNGNSSTTVFSETIDGGNSSTTVFSGVYDGGNV